ncbi:glycosyl hydrolase [Treponema sp.]|uniref:glycosyl hydrolase n=1 Tax=Treponema sp. TaxID=166 RepID=UPI0025E154D2|nr:glycosyl hydrolase [Treponema sp.]MCR5218274.1 hypothetical protein [Treponema sp.]
MKRHLLFLTFAMFTYALSAQSLSSKRGLCYNSLSEKERSCLENSNVSWGYNWYQNPGDSGLGPEKAVDFLPMIWGGGEDFEDMIKRTEEYLFTHKNVKCILGFNEPMMKKQYGGCELTPAEAAEKWPQLESLALKFNTKLASPALTWGFEPLSDGIVYGSPEMWMDTFIEEYKKLNKGKEPHYDYLALHSYMDYPSAVMWFCSTYGSRYNKKVLLTEFCAWDQDQNQIPHQDKYEQISSMTQKVEAMDSEDIVAGYAWFMSHAQVKNIPYNSIFTKINSKGKLTELGQVYLYMTDVSKDKLYKTEQIIPACAYSSSSNYNREKGNKCDDGERFNTPVGIACASDKKNKKIFKEIPLELGNFKNKRFASYKVEIPADGDYKFTLRILTDDEEAYAVSCDGIMIAEKVIPSTKAKWKDIELEGQLTKGIHQIKISTEGNAKKAKFYWFKIERKEN